MRNGISGDQLYNCDESGLNFKMLPSCTLATKEEDRAPGYKKRNIVSRFWPAVMLQETINSKLGVIGKSH